MKSVPHSAQYILGEYGPLTLFLQTAGYKGLFFQFVKIKLMLFNIPFPPPRHILKHLTVHSTEEFETDLSFVLGVEQCFKDIILPLSEKGFKRAF